MHRMIVAATLSIVLVGCSSQPAPPPQQETASRSPESAAGPVSPPTTDDEMLKSAMSAATDAVARDATIIAFDEKMQVRTLREGTNGWTCMPDMPSSPGADPMCLDKNGMEWAQAWMSHKNPPANKMGFGYMLMGGSDASNEDPFAEKPAEGRSWVDTGPHVMVLNIGKQFEGYPTTPENTEAPYVMFPNTPYAHLMLPVK